MTGIPEPPPTGLGAAGSAGRGDPLARHRIRIGGPHVPRILLAAAGVVAIGLAAYMAGQNDAEAPRTLVERPTLRPEPPDRPTYADLAPRPAPAPPVPIATPPPDPPAAPAPARGPAAPNRLRERALAAGVGGWTRPDRADVLTAAAAAEAGAATGAGATCVVPPGTPIHATTRNAAVSEQGGILVAGVTRDVWGTGFDCLALPAGTTVTLTLTKGATRGQTRLVATDPVFVRPWPLNDTIRAEAVVSDREGAAGLPGRVQVPWASTALLIAASTAVDLVAAALSGGSTLLGPILGRNAERPLDRAAREALERAPVIRLEPGEAVVVMLGGELQTRAQR